MKETREEIRAKLQAEANEMIDELIRWSEEVEEPNLEQIEDILLKLRKRLSEQRG